MKKIKILILGILILLYSNSLSFTSPSGLLLIPTTDILNTYEYDIGLQIDGKFPITSGDTLFTYLAQFGICKNLEGGIDFSLTKGEGFPTYNVKYLVYDKNFKIATGIQNIVKGGNINYYFTCSKKIKEYRLHLGASTEKDNNNIFVGIDKTINKLTIMSDYINKNSGCFCVGLSYNLAENLSFLLSYNKPNDKNEKNSYTFNIIHLGKLK